MRKVKIQGNASGTGVLTVTAPNTSTDRTITLPDSTGTLATTADNGSQLDHSGSKKIEATATGVDITGSATADTSLKVGTIGVVGNTANDVNIYSTGSGHNGLRMHANGILPTDNTGTIVDADADLGDPSYRFKDLYLEGGAYIGGNGSANKLGDYETGTWTPTNAGGWASLDLDCVGKYTKIGNMVHVVAFINVNGSGIGSGDITMGGLPFTSSGISDYRPAISVFAYKLYSNVNNYISGLINSGGTLIYIREGGGTGDGADMGNHFDGGSSIYFQATYTTG